MTELTNTHPHPKLIRLIFPVVGFRFLCPLLDVGGSSPGWAQNWPGSICEQAYYVGNRKKKYLGRRLPHPHLMHCTNWTRRIYEEMTLEQCFHSSQPLLPPLKGPWWYKHPKGFLETIQMEGWDVMEGTILGNGGNLKVKREREK